MWARPSRERSGWTVTGRFSAISNFRLRVETVYKHLQARSGLADPVLCTTRTLLIAGQKSISSLEHHSSDGYWLCVYWLALSQRISGT